VAESCQKHSALIWLEVIEDENRKKNEEEISSPRRGWVLGGLGVFSRNTVTTRGNIGDFCDFIRNICSKKGNVVRNILDFDAGPKLSPPRPGEISRPSVPSVPRQCFVGFLRFWKRAGSVPDPSQGSHGKVFADNPRYPRNGGRRRQSR